MSHAPKASIVLVHGLWADGSCWSKVTPALLQQGYEVIAVQNPLTSLEDDIAAVGRALDRAKAPVVLVGHSWGGFVITAAGQDARVKSLVYVAALAPDSGETGASLGQGFAPAPLFNHLEVVGGYIWLTREAVPYFAGDVNEAEQDLIHATQGPANAGLFGATVSGVPAWKSKPSYYLLATQDGAINPDQQRAMSAKIKATVTEVASSHVPMLSQPASVVELIGRAATHV
jgi:pimeloyl-ACP methyl ester carboxylesterase